MSTWSAHRGRAEVLREAYPFAAEMLTLYLALLDVWEEAFDLARAERPTRLAVWAADRVLPKVISATETAGPESLAKAAREVVEAESILATWLAGDELPPVEQYLARAALRAPMAASEALEAAEPAADRRCPRCGGPPQLSVRTGTGDRLVSGRRQLMCSRCEHLWSYSSSACPSCGETTGSQRTVYAEERAGPVVGRNDTDDGDEATFPHLRIDSCATCERYLIDVDLGLDPRAVPEVDELVALPLDLYAADRGLSEITPNLMGF
jgi:formate dehydrogenase maturation protein FdhE